MAEKNKKNENIQENLNDDSLNNNENETVETIDEILNTDQVLAEKDDLIAELNQQLNEQKLLRAADIDNLNKFNTKRLIEIRKYGASDLAMELIKPIDLLKKVVESLQGNEAFKNYLTGFEMVVRQMEQALENNGITLIDVKPGDEFDDQIHNANEAVEGTKFSENTIIEIISNGYKIHDRVLVHALVKVAK
ncbi:nucleotide exchange factor GrpE [Mesoplasma syrphidae]|nr:nucleotide exchange factor GrpE [Mesoplasma syrphidae]